MRQVGASLGVLRPAVRLYRRLFNADYEGAFDQATQARIRTGDCIWDVGANVGHYSGQFAALVGSTGKVVCFEPSPATLQKLTASVAGFDQVVIEQVALSNSKGEMAFFTSADGDVTDSLDPLAAGKDATRISVKVETGDTYADKYPPNLIKIDVEGFELEVLEGLPQTLLSPSLHTVAIEMHFQVMVERGLDGAPARITDLLRKSGFAISWTDPSHLVASRKPN